LNFTGESFAWGAYRRYIEKTIRPHDQEAMKKLSNKNDNKQSGKLCFEFCMQSYKRKNTAMGILESHRFIEMKASE
jgi:hypothetical protein